MMNQITKIDNLVNISEERKIELLNFLDNYTRMPGADLLLGLKEAIDTKYCKTDDEFTYLCFMFGSCSGTDLTIRAMKILGKLPKIDPKVKGGLLKQVQKEMDDNLGK